MTIKSAQIASHAGSFILSGGRLLRVIPLRIVGSGFCPIMRGLPRAMLAPDVSVGKTENITLIDNFSLKMRYRNLDKITV